MHIYIYIRVFLLKCCDCLILIVSTLTFSSSCFYIIHFFIIYLLLVPKFFFLHSTNIIIHCSNCPSWWTHTGLFPNKRGAMLPKRRRLE